MSDSDRLQPTIAVADGQASHHGRGGVLSQSFLALLATQFLVALNDNMFRWLVVPVAQALMPEKYADIVLSAGLACFVLPFLVLAAPAGYLADRFSKRRVIIGCKVAEIAIMALGIAVILWGNVYVMLLLVALMGAQSALFSPSKFGSIPEIVRSDRVAAANGMIGMTTVLAIVIGTVAGYYLYDVTTLRSSTGELLMKPGHYRWWISASALIGVATVGWIASLFIGHLRSANPQRKAPFDIVSQTVRDLGALVAHRPLLLTAMGIVFFWSLGALAQLNINLFGRQVLLLQGEQVYIGCLLGVLAAGVGLGSVLAGLLSAGKIELGMVSFATAGIAVSTMLLYTVPGGTGTANSPAYLWSCVWLLTLGISAGMFDVPLQAFLQEHAPERTRGSILAAANFVTFSGMLAASGVFYLLATLLGLGGRQIFLLSGVVTVPMLLCVVWILKRETVRFTLWLLSRLLYRVHVEGLENIPDSGGAVIAPNHVSWADGVLVGLSCPRHIRMVVYAGYFETWWLSWLGRLAQVIPIKPGRRSVVESIRTARQALRDGELVGIFPEGGLTRTGEMQQFQPGIMSILKGTDVPVIPVYLEGLWGSIFSFERGRLFWKMPRKWPYPVTIRFGRPIPTPHDVEQVRQAVEALGENGGQAVGGRRWLEE